MQTRTRFFPGHQPAGWHALIAFVVLAGFNGSSFAVEPTDENIVVATVQGDVRVTMHGQTRAAKPGSVITPPATIRTGRDGAIELRQGRTRASIAADTHVEIPTLPLRGKFVERIVQPRGNVFYDVGPRKGQKLRVETPYLVAVIKGTQFNVAAHAESATVSLFEGRLEVWTPDASDVVQLNAGEIATRGRGDRRIRVLLMATGETLRASNTSPEEGADTRSSSAFDPVGQRVTSGDLVTGVDSTLLSPIDGASTITAELVDSKVELGATDLAAGVDAGVDLGAASLATSVDAAVDLGAGTVELGAGADASLGGLVDAGVDATAGVDLGAGTVDLGADATVADTPVALDAGVDLSSLAIDASAELGPLEVDLGVDLGATDPEPAAETEPTIVDEVVEPLRGLLGL